MKWLDEYMIPYFGLSEGIHIYDFEADDRFFEHFENPEIKGGNIRLVLTLIKKPGFMELEFDIQGSLEVICDRCLEIFQYPVATREKLFIRFGEKTEEQSENLVIIARDETRINIAQYLYEYSSLCLPLSKVHPPNAKGEEACDRDMIRRLELLQSKKEESIDPRWEALLKLKNNN